jgi:5-carboxyvanillate decarboxylase
MDSFLNNPRMKDRLINPDTRLQEMDKSGTDVAVLSLNPPALQQYRDAEPATSLATAIIDHLVDIIRAWLTRFAGLGTIAPQDTEKAAMELKRVMGALGLDGVTIYSHTLGHYLDEPQFEPIPAAAEEESATIYLHPRVPSPEMVNPYQAEAGLHAIRLIMSGVLDRHPKLQFVLGHLGEALPFWMWRLDNIRERTFQWQGKRLNMPKLELKPTEYLRRNFAVSTSGMNDQEVLRFTLSKLGDKNVMFAIDYPYEDSNQATRFLSEAALTNDQRALGSHSNAER